MRFFTITLILQHWRQIASGQDFSVILHYSFFIKWNVLHLKNDLYLSFTVLAIVFLPSLLSMNKLGVHSLHLEKELNTLYVCSSGDLQLDLGGYILEYFKITWKKGRQRRGGEGEGRGGMPELRWSYWRRSFSHKFQETASTWRLYWSDWNCAHCVCVCVCAHRCPLGAWLWPGYALSGD